MILLFVIGGVLFLVLAYGAMIAGFLWLLFTSLPWPLAVFLLAAAALWGWLNPDSAP